jgi:hypothetical protein
LLQQQQFNAAALSALPAAAQASVKGVLLGFHSQAEQLLNSMADELQFEIIPAVKEEVSPTMSCVTSRVQRILVIVMPEGCRTNRV